MTTDLNDRIAKAKGWEFRAAARAYVSPDGRLYTDELPDYVGTLEGVAGMMQELNERVMLSEHRWVWGWSKALQCHFCELMDRYGGTDVSYDSGKDRPGDCVGEGWLSVFGKEA